MIDKSLNSILQTILKYGFQYGLKTKNASASLLYNWDTIISVHNGYPMASQTRINSVDWSAVNNLWSTTTMKEISLEYCDMGQVIGSITMTLKRKGRALSIVIHILSLWISSKDNHLQKKTSFNCALGCLLSLCDWLPGKRDSSKFCSVHTDSTTPLTLSLPC